jgi:hypothetical protein
MASTVCNKLTHSEKFPTPSEKSCVKNLIVVTMPIVTMLIVTMLMVTMLIFMLMLTTLMPC